MSSDDFVSDPTLCGESAARAISFEQLDDGDDGRQRWRATQARQVIGIVTVAPNESFWRAEGGDGRLSRLRLASVFECLEFLALQRLHRPL